MATNPITDPLPRPVQPIAASEIPVQPNASHGIEYKDSRNLAEDIQRKTIVHIFIFAGRPDQVELDAALGSIRAGHPHPWEIDSYLVHVKFEHFLHGPDPDTAGQTPTTDRDSKGYTKVTATYRQMPCPGRWEEQGGVALISRLEWFDRFDPPRSLRGTREGVSIMVPHETYKRHFPKVMLSAAKYNELADEVGTVNGFAWRGREPGYWLLEGWLPKLLYGDPANSAAYELTLMWRGDPERHHQWWYPKLNENTYRPPDPIPGDTRDTFYARVFDKRSIYRPSEKDWDLIVPLRGTPCDPPAATS